MDGKFIPIIITAAVAIIVVFWLVRLITGIIKTKKFYEKKMAEKVQNDARSIKPDENADAVKSADIAENKDEETNSL